MNIIGALKEGEITRDEFQVLAWLRFVGEWHGTKEELAEALQWPHTPAHLGKVLRRLHLAGRIESSARERVGGAFDLALPAAVAAGSNPHGHTDCDPEALQAGRTSIHTNSMINEVMSSEVSNSQLNELASGEYAGAATAASTHRSSVVGASGQEVESPETGEPSGRAPEARPAPEWAALAEEIDAELGNGTPVSETVARFGEREPAAITDTEAHMMRLRRGR